MKKIPEKREHFYIILFCFKISAYTQTKISKSNKLAQIGLLIR